MTVESGRRRVHIVLPDALLREIDARVGQRQRSAFIQEAIEEKLRREKLLESLDEMAGSLAGVDIPGWESSAAAAEWVRALRRADPVGVGEQPGDRAAWHGIQLPTMERCDLQS